MTRGGATSCRPGHGRRQTEDVKLKVKGKLNTKNRIGVKSSLRTISRHQPLTETRSQHPPLQKELKLVETKKMRSQIGCFFFLAVAGLVAGLETETNTLPWWPSKADENGGVDARPDHNVEYVDNQSNYEDQGKEVSKRGTDD